MRSLESQKLDMQLMQTFIKKTLYSLVKTNLQKLRGKIKMTQTEKIKQQMAKTDNKGGAPTQKDKPKTIEDYLKQMAPAMQEALPKHLDVDRLMRLTMTTIRTTSELRQADVASLLGGVMQDSQICLETGFLGQ